jgi:hypothetical protein
MILVLEIRDEVSAAFDQRTHMPLSARDMQRCRIADVPGYLFEGQTARGPKVAEKIAQPHIGVGKDSSRLRPHPPSISSRRPPVRSRPSNR